MSAPAGGCDAHAHVFGPVEQFPLHKPGPGVANTGASIEALLAMHKAHGFERGVLVQPVEYGADHRYLLHALKVAGPGYRGVAMADQDLTETALGDLARQGVVGLRFMFIDAIGLTPTPEVFQRGIVWARRFGLQLRLLVSLTEHPELSAILAAVDDVPIVLEHMSLTGPGKDTTALETLLRKPNVWLMLSAGQRRSAEGPPWNDAVALGQGLAAVAPERCIWGSDWPYLGRGPQLPEAEALDLLRRYLPNEAAMRAVLVDNPARLYDPR